jgi:hypothetical protein
VRTDIFNILKASPGKYVEKLSTYDRDRLVGQHGFKLLQLILFILAILGERWIYIGSKICWYLDSKMKKKIVSDALLWPK